VSHVIAYCNIICILRGVIMYSASHNECSEVDIPLSSFWSFYEFTCNFLTYRRLELIIITTRTFELLNMEDLLMGYVDMDSFDCQVIFI